MNVVEIQSFRAAVEFDPSWLDWLWSGRQRTSMRNGTVGHDTRLFFFLFWFLFLTASISFVIFVLTLVRLFVCLFVRSSAMCSRLPPLCVCLCVCVCRGGRRRVARTVFNDVPQCSAPSQAQSAKFADADCARKLSPTLLDPHSFSFFFRFPGFLN